MTVRYYGKRIITVGILAFIVLPVIYLIVID